jgi:hypothetical protein
VFSIEMTRCLSATMENHNATAMPICGIREIPSAITKHHCDGRISSGVTPRTILKVAANSPMGEPLTGANSTGSILQSRKHVIISAA